jgi:predicted nucleic acid-binding protein
MPSAFLDSNVILYAALPPKEDRRKAGVAQDLLKTSDFGVSGQILAEVYNVMSKTIEPKIDEAEIDLWIISLAERPFAPIDAALVRRGIAISRRYKISYWDAAIIAAAERLGADTLFTEDLNDGQVYGAVTARNPFR